MWIAKRQVSALIFFSLFPVWWMKQGEHWSPYRGNSVNCRGNNNISCRGILPKMRSIFPSYKKHKGIDHINDMWFTLMINAYLLFKKKLKTSVFLNEKLLKLYVYLYSRTITSIISSRNLFLFFLLFSNNLFLFLTHFKFLTRSFNFG